MNTEFLQACEKLFPYFRMDFPATIEYQKRIEQEMELIAELDFADHFVRVKNILDLTADIPHITRGSAGCSLVCYLMNISQIDPVEKNIPLVRFMSPHRDSLPDIDLDFPHIYHEEVMKRIFNRWPNTAARLSNYVKYKSRSAFREALRRIQYSGKINRDTVPDDLPDKTRIKVEKIMNKIIGHKRCISKHCGGIVFFDHGLPKSLLTAQNQILLDKHEVEDLAILKVDVLSNRGLTQLVDIQGKRPWEYPDLDPDTVDLMSQCRTIGITQGQSPVFRRVLKNLDVRCRDDVILCSALIRPAAVTGRRKATFFREIQKPGVQYRGGLVYDEDAISLISDTIGCNPADADMYRRAFIKGNEEVAMEFIQRIGYHENKNEIIDLLKNMDGFGLCKAHAINLGNLVWGLGYEKAHNPAKFWKSAFNHSASMYKPWVYVEEAKVDGMKFSGHRAPFELDGNTLVNLDYRANLFSDQISEYREHGMWTHADFMPGMYYHSDGDKVEIRGLIACGRNYKKDAKKYITFITLGVGSGQLIDCVIPYDRDWRDSDVISGKGFIRNRAGNTVVELYDHKTEVI